MTDTVVVTTCETGQCTVTFMVEPPPYSQERIDDLAIMGGFFLAGACVIYFWKRLLKLFEVDSNGD